MRPMAKWLVWMVRTAIIMVTFTTIRNPFFMIMMDDSDGLEQSTMDEWEEGGIVTGWHPI